MEKIQRLDSVSKVFFVLLDSIVVPHSFAFCRFFWCKFACLVHCVLSDHCSVTLKHDVCKFCPQQNPIKDNQKAEDDVNHHIKSWIFLSMSKKGRSYVAEKS